MTTEMENWQWLEILDKINNIADKNTQSQILQTINNLISVVAKELKQDSTISILNTLSSKLDAIVESLGSPKPTYSVTVTASAVAANKHHLAIFNNNPNIRIAVRRIIVGAEVTGTVTGFQMSYRIQRISAISGGTSVPIAKFDTGDPDVANITSVANPTSATVVSTLDNIIVNPEETGGQHYTEKIYGSYGIKPIVLRQGEGISVQQYGTAGAGTTTITIIFTVE